MGIVLFGDTTIACHPEPLFWAKRPPAMSHVSTRQAEHFGQKPLDFLAKMPKESEEVGYIPEDTSAKSRPQDHSVIVIWTSVKPTPDRPTQARRARPV